MENKPERLIFFLNATSIYQYNYPIVFHDGDNDGNDDDDDGGSGTTFWVPSIPRNECDPVTWNALGGLLIN